jgi:hypothetical protein
MEAMTRMSWTDDRLDDLSGKVESLQTLMFVVICAVIGGMATLCAALIVMQA